MANRSLREKLHQVPAAIYGAEPLHYLQPQAGAAEKQKPATKTTQTGEKAGNDETQENAINPK